MEAAAAFDTPPRVAIGMSTRPFDTAGAIASDCRPLECVERGCPVAIASDIAVECRPVEIGERGCLIVIPGVIAYGWRPLTCVSTSCPVDIVRINASDCRPVEVVEMGSPLVIAADIVRIVDSDCRRVDFVESDFPVALASNLAVGYRLVPFGGRGDPVVVTGAIATDDRPLGSIETGCAVGIVGTVISDPITTDCVKTDSPVIIAGDTAVDCRSPEFGETPCSASDNRTTLSLAANTPGVGVCDIS